MTGSHSPLAIRESRAVCYLAKPWNFLGRAWGASAFLTRSWCFLSSATHQVTRISAWSDVGGLRGGVLVAAGALSRASASTSHPCIIHSTGRGCVKRREGSCRRSPPDLHGLPRYLGTLWHILLFLLKFNSPFPVGPLKSWAFLGELGSRGLCWKNGR